MADLSLMGGKLQLYRRGDGKTWHCSASVSGKQRRTSTKEESVDAARHVAEDWYLTLKGRSVPVLNFRQKALIGLLRAFGGRLSGVEF